MKNILFEQVAEWVDLHWICIFCIINCYKTIFTQELCTVSGEWSQHIVRMFTFSAHNMSNALFR